MAAIHVMKRILRRIETDVDNPHQMYRKEPAAIKILFGPGKRQPHDDQQVLLTQKLVAIEALVEAHFEAYEQHGDRAKLANAMEVCKKRALIIWNETIMIYQSWILVDHLSDARKTKLEKDLLIDLIQVPAVIRTADHDGLLLILKAVIKLDGIMVRNLYGEKDFQSILAELAVSKIPLPLRDKFRHFDLQCKLHIHQQNMLAKLKQFLNHEVQQARTLKNFAARQRGHPRPQPHQHQKQCQHGDGPQPSHYCSWNLMATTSHECHQANHIALEGSLMTSNGSSGRGGSARGPPVPRRLISPIQPTRSIENVGGIDWIDRSSDLDSSWSKI